MIANKDKCQCRDIDNNCEECSEGWTAEEVKQREIKYRDILKKLTKESEGWEIVEFDSSAFPNSMKLRLKKKRERKTIVIGMESLNLSIKSINKTKVK